MPIPLENRGRYSSALQHEFGHWVVARVLGFTSGDIALYENQAHSSVELIPSIQTLDDAARYLENRVCILFAGAIAESTSSGGKLDRQKSMALFTNTASNDHAKIRELLRLLAAIRHPECDKAQLQKHLTRIDKSLAERTADLVCRNAKLINDLKMYAMACLDKAYDSGDLSPEFKLSQEEIESFPDLNERLAR